MPNFSGGAKAGSPVVEAALKELKKVRLQIYRLSQYIYDLWASIIFD
jgi:hypothetical protein